MRLLVSLLLASQFSFASPFSLQAKHTQVERFFVEPQETVITVIAFQPNCGIEFNEALVIHGVEGGVGHVYQVRNRGPKAVRSYQVAALTSAGTGAEWAYQAKESESLFLPGEMRPKSLENFGIEMVPLTDELRKKHRLHGPLIGIVVFLVVHVVYSDGTEYNGKVEYQALKEFFDKSRVTVPR